MSSQRLRQWHSDVQKMLEIIAKNSTRSPEGKFVILENPEIDNLHSRMYLNNLNLIKITALTQ